MLVLGIDTGTPYCGIAVSRSGEIIGESGLLLGKRHQEELAPEIERLLAGLGLTASSLDGVAVSAGPGSFTGLRVGLALAKGLCFATGAALLLVPTLQAVAAGLPFLRHPVCPLLNAGKGEVYAGLYDTSSGNAECLRPDTVVHPERISDIITQPTVLVGTGVVAYRGAIVEQLGEMALLPPFAPATHCAPAVAYLGGIRMGLGEHDDLASAEPLYIRKCDAEVGRGAGAL